MRECKEYGIAKRVSVTSEYINHAIHNQPFKEVEIFEKKVKYIEGKVVGLVSKTATSQQYFNATTQKSDKLKSKLSSLYNRVMKLEKKQQLIKDTFEETGSTSLIRQNEPVSTFFNSRESM